MLLLGTRRVNTARMRDDPTSTIGRYDILAMLPIAAFTATANIVDIYYIWPQCKLWAHTP